MDIVFSVIKIVNAFIKMLSAEAPFILFIHMQVILSVLLLYRVDWVDSIVFTASMRLSHSSLHLKFIYLLV